MADSTNCNITFIKWSVAFPTPDGKRQAFLRAIASLCSFPLLTPTQSATDERRKEPFDPTNVRELEDYFDSRSFWRTKQPKNRCNIVSTGRILGALGLEFDKVRPKYVEPIWTSLEELTNHLEPEYGTLYFYWTDSDDEGHLRIANSSVFRLFFDYYDAGPSGIGARTWFGPELSSKIGEDILLEAGAARTDWGGWDLILLDRPWERPFDEILERHRVVDEIVRRSGQFGIHELGPPTPGPNWIPIPRNL